MLKKNKTMNRIKFYIVLGFVSLIFTAQAQELPPSPSTDNDLNWNSNVSYDLLGNTLSKGISYYNSLGKGDTKSNLGFSYQ